MFTRAIDSGPSLIFIDELEALCPNRAVPLEKNPYF